MIKSTLRALVDTVDGRGGRSVLAGLANGIVKVAGRDQKFSVDSEGDWVNAQDGASFVSPDILFTKLSDKQAEIRDLWCYQHDVQAGDVIVDVGAGIGDEAVVFSKMVGPTGRVIAIEAHPHTFRCLKKTIAQSGLKNVTAIHCAVADAEGTLTIEDSADQNHISHSIMKSSASGVEVPAHRLDTILKREKITDLAMLKMNIEGAERLAIKGMRKDDYSIRHYAISCHDFVADRDGTDELRTREEVLKHFGDMGLKIEQRLGDPRPWVRDYVYAKEVRG
ncbi:FkbM family methyltransferase [Pontixanthobacter aestiaquae]|uniref:FkbM family methyltransferase n=1 Tax=Pontixanthobacter aestiaquae TaxID=1509367 RepID=A0A844Z5H0_9SPHN|nr:FkbM family methyltransferase [Pontixanthobacter aestiaquae]MDN3646949.1 FkbM family methyltransferase [Pontixanthobacter aestiaquae]MXO82070.1 FkbM family methyltransferase [Pontixanthobacter aestiaquae]